MGKLSRKRKSVEETAELDIRADTIEDEIIDLVDLVEETAPAQDDVSADENLETIETNLDLFLVEGEELDDTLDEELMGVNVGDSNETLTHENDADLDFEKSLVKMFETTELLAAELVEKSSQTKKEGEESLTVGADPSDDGNVNLGLAAKATAETAGTGKVLESEDKLPENLFVNLERVKKTPGKKDGATAVDTEPEAIPDKTNWIDSSRYYPLTVHAIDKKIAEHKKEIEKLVAGKEQLKKIYVHLRSILYLEGEELRKTVMLIFAKYWSLKLFFLNKTKGGGFNKNDGALIVNYNIETDPKDRSLAYADDNEDQLDDLIFIDTRVLYKLTAAIIDGHLSVEEAKKILFKKGRVEF